MSQGDDVLDAEDYKPPPDKFDIYLPWACRVFQLGNVSITRVTQREYVSQTHQKGKSTGRVKKAHEVTHSTLVSDQTITIDENYEDIKITCIYDTSSNLVELKFEDKRQLPQKLFVLINLLVQFQPYLTNITIGKGLNNHVLRELTKTMQIVNITDICLDDSRVQVSNYHMLLEIPSNLRQLSLCRCNIDDDMLYDIAQMLIFPLHASMNLALLILASNFITDVGAKHLASALRANRCLLYINLSDNSINDEGAISIFNLLMKFPMTYEEVIASRKGYVDHLYEQKFKAMSITRVSDKNVTIPKAPIKLAMKKSNETSKSILGHDKHYDHPFAAKHVIDKNGVTYSRGNNALAYLNLAYNHLTIMSAKKILEVLRYQKSSGRSPTGLVNVNVEGNFLPKICIELIEINFLLERALDETFATPKRKSFKNK